MPDTGATTARWLAGQLAARAKGRVIELCFLRSNLTRRCVLRARDSVPSKNISIVPFFGWQIYPTGDSACASSSEDVQSR